MALWRIWLKFREFIKCLLSYSGGSNPDLQGEGGENDQERLPYVGLHKPLHPLTAHKKQK